MEKKTIYVMLAIACIIALWFFGSGRTSIHDLRIGTCNTRAEFESIENQQREERQVVDRAAEAAERSRETIRNSQQTIREIENIERDDRALIEENRKILQRIRERSRTEDPG